jgi:hypothetical protein
MPARAACPPWSIEEHAESFIVKDPNGQARGYFYFVVCEELRSH